MPALQPDIRRSLCKVHALSILLVPSVHALTIRKQITTLCRHVQQDAVLAGLRKTKTQLTMSQGIL